MKSPQGVEKVVVLATLSPEWRAKVLADAITAAEEAGIELGESERSVLGSISSRMLAGMIDSFGKSVPRPAGLGTLAAGAAATLLVASMVGCSDDPGPATKGDRADQPPANPRKQEDPVPRTLGIQPDMPLPKNPPPPTPVQPPAEDAPRK
jgi:hypothetical protein